MTKTTIGDIFKIPEAVHQGDFVLRLTEGLQPDRRKQTLQQYVVTPQLVQSFEQALSLIGSAVTSNSSKGAYLHGSFGSGKSHFMAVLDMILEGDSDARSIPELAGAIRKANSWWEGGKYLVVPFHMIGAQSMESAILGGYAAYVRDKHPDAPTPGFYRSGGLIQDANDLRQTMGDDLFFSKLGRSGEAEGWGTMGAGWDAASYEAAAAADPDDAEHQRLVGELVDAFFRNLRGQADAGSYISLDRGLAVMARHAQELGYSAVVLFLDELILWLASHSQDTSFLNREGQKVAKLVEAEDAGRPIPIVSFIARQRDLRELVGNSVPGAQQLAFADVLQWWEARFDKIVLEDRNLPAIIERRLLQTKGEAEKRALHEAFEQTARVRREVLDILLTHEGDRKMFEQVYPFSPALVQVLVALSSLLQRERTALKLMLQLLVQNRDRLELGDVIPVGDLFDVIIEGDEPFTPAIKNLFDQARNIWTRKLAPLLEAEHGVQEHEVREGTADAAVIRRYRADAGLLKTLLLSTLAPEVEALRNLTPQRLAALNHGTIRSPLPNGEASTVLNKVRAWASHVGEIQLSADATNPVITMQLSGVDVEGVIENARSIDNFGNRVRTVKELVFGDIGIDLSVATVLAPEYPWLWRGTARRAEVLMQNVRLCTDENLRPGDGAWRVVIDYPFDEDAGRGPADDRARLNDFRQGGESVRTIAWIPSFLNERALEDLGRLGVLNHVLSGQRLEEYGGHLQPAERAEARATLKSQRDQLERRVKISLEQAYGIAQGATADLHTSHALDEHFQALASGLRLQPPPGGGFKSSIEHLLDQAMQSQYPAHPRFEGEVRRTGLKRALEVIREAVDSADGRAVMERNHRDEIRRIVQPLRLATCGEAHLSLNDDWKTHFTRKLAAEGVVNPTVRQLRQWIDEPQPMGLPEDVSDLVILAWAAQSGRTPYLHGAAVRGEIGGLNRECELREQALPDESVWKLAVQRAAAIFGEAGTGAGRNPGNVASLTQALRRHGADKASAVRDYRDALKRRAADWGVASDSARLRTASAALDVLIALADSNADPVSVLTEADIQTSADAMGSVMANADSLAKVLQSPQWDVLDALRSQGRTDEAAVALATAVAEALRDDEHVTSLSKQVSAQHRKALELITAPTVKPPQPSPPAKPQPAGAELRSDVRTAVDARGLGEIMGEMKKSLEEDPSLRADIQYRIYRTEEGGSGA